MEKISNGYELSMETTGNGNDTYIHFNLEQESDVILRIMTTDFVEVRLLVNELMMPGEQRILFSPGNLSADTYVVRLIINKENAIDIENLNFKIV